MDVVELKVWTVFLVFWMSISLAPSENNTLDFSLLMSCPALPLYQKSLKHWKEFEESEWWGGQKR